MHLDTYYHYEVAVLLRFIYLGFLAVNFFFFWLCLCCCTRAFSRCGEQWLLSSCGPQASYCSGFSCCGAWASVLVAKGLSCPVVCGIFWDQGLNSCPLPWQVDSKPLNHQGNLKFLFYCSFLNQILQTHQIIKNSITNTLHSLPRFDK